MRCDCVSEDEHFAVIEGYDTAGSLDHGGDSDDTKVKIKR